MVARPRAACKVTCVTTAAYQTGNGGITALHQHVIIMYSTKPLPLVPNITELKKKKGNLPLTQRTQRQGFL